LVINVIKGEKTLAELAKLRDAPASKS